MFEILKKIFTRLFFNPYKFVQRHSNISLSSGIIFLKSTRFRMKKTNKITLGEHSMLGCSFIFESDEGEIEIGNNTFIHSGTELIARSKISIGNNVMISWGCTIYDHNSHSLDWNERAKDLNRTIVAYHNGVDLLTDKDWSTVKVAPITIKDKVWIGFGCTILSGVTIGEGAIIGSQSVIRQDVEPWTVMIGNPAIPVKKIDPI